MEDLNKVDEYTLKKENEVVEKKDDDFDELLELHKENFPQNYESDSDENNAAEIEKEMKQEFLSKTQFKELSEELADIMFAKQEELLAISDMIVDDYIDISRKNKIMIDLVDKYTKEVKEIDENEIINAIDDLQRQLHKINKNSKYKTIVFSTIYFVLGGAIFYTIATFQNEIMKFLGV